VNITGRATGISNLASITGALDMAIRSLGRCGQGARGDSRKAAGCSAAPVPSQRVLTAGLLVGGVWLLVSPPNTLLLLLAAAAAFGVTMALPSGCRHAGDSPTQQHQPVGPGVDLGAAGGSRSAACQHACARPSCPQDLRPDRPRPPRQAGQGLRPNGCRALPTAAEGVCTVARHSSHPRGSSVHGLAARNAVAIATVVLCESDR